MRLGVSIRKQLLAKASSATATGRELFVHARLKRNEVAETGSRSATLRLKELAELRRSSCGSRWNFACHRPQDDKPMK